MNKDLMSALYVSYNEKIGVLCDDEDNTISIVLGTDLPSASTTEKSIRAEEP